MSLHLCRVVLVQTHYPGNLGATARAMRNFGLGDLVLVSPIANRDDPNARQMSTHGEIILTGARVVHELSDAVNDCALVVGTTGHSGGPFRQQNVGTPAEVMPRVVDVLKQDRSAALVFGPEPTGLSNEIVTRCHHLIRIPTADEYSSLNLAHAVAICVYELRQAWLAAAPRVEVASELANVEFQEQMFRQLQIALEEIHFLYGDKADSLMHAVRHLLGKARLTEMEAKVLLGLARQIHWYVENHPRQ
jgi:tRNA/rRNA methyltransferase